MLRPLFQIEVPSIGRIFRLVPRPHWQRRTRLSDKGSDCVRYLCPTFELPVAGAAALFCTANASPLHTNNCARHSWQRQRRENLHWCKLKKTMYALVFFALELWQGSWVHYSLYIKQGLQLSLEFQNTKSNPPFPPLCSFFLMHCTHVCCTCVWKFSLHVLTFVLSIEITTSFWQTCLCCSSTDISFSLSQFPIRLLHATNSTIIKESSMLCPLCVLCFQLSLDPPPSWIFAPTSSLKRLQRDYYVKDQAW